ncbi:hypothetical protein [Methanobacterium alcaliphilum]|uniref:hypothetical protein n=1 Tax=Methanobacterium alcaliphilum TaxID=392018 RepID=UPI00200AF695|nr:hypothetical protein [Methanobacterium alcaliphilum]MCK9152248.1 hypothetical protein [Methanobacterium alcaliphilum]
MEENNIKVTEKDVIDTLDIFTKVPSILLKRWVSKKSNLVKSFESQVISYSTRLSLEEKCKVEKILEMPINDLQIILNNAYRRTGKRQLKILADPSAEDFIEVNLQELKRVLELND